MSTLLEKYSGLLNVPEKLGLGDFEWDEADAHISPIKETPLKKALMGKTNSSLVLISAGTLVWAARALADYGEVLPCTQIAETLLCWQADARYYDRDAPRFFQDDDGHEYVEDEIAESFASKGTTVFKMAPGRHTAFPNVDDTANLICLLRHILDDEATQEFKRWLEDLIQRLDQIATNPYQTFKTRYDFESKADFRVYVAQNMGEPLPPSVTNLNNDFEAETASAQFSKYLATVDWKTNPYLSNPNKMIALGFEGKPYS